MREAVMQCLEGATAVGVLGAVFVYADRARAWIDARHDAKAWEARTLRVANARPTSTEINERRIAR
jgi:hypothetical protein